MSMNDHGNEDFGAMIIAHIAETISGGVSTVLNSLYNNQLKDPEVRHIYILIPEHQIKSFSAFRSEKSTVVLFGGKNRLSRVASLALCLLNNRHIKADIVHLHSTFAGLAYRLLPIKIHGKIIYQPHGISFDKDRIKSRIKRAIYSKVELALSKKTHKTIAISVHEKTQIEEAGIKNCFLARNGVPETIIDRHYLEKKRDRYIFIGRLDHQKGLDILLASWTSLNLPYDLAIAGQSILKNSSAQEVKDSRIKYLGWVDPKDIDELIFHAKAIIVPSRWEGFGLVVAEAFRNGTPVIASRKGALPEIVSEGKTGFLFDLESAPQSLLIAIQRLEQSDSANLSKNCRSEYESNMQEKTMTEQIKQSYKS